MTMREAQAETSSPSRESQRPIWRRNITAWLALDLLVFSTLGLAYLPLGYFNVMIALTIAAVKIVIVAVWFMELRLAKSFIRLASAAGFVWLLVMFSLTFSDVATR
jgi:cytochrome c oxidase subunit 4